eukprot:365390-Chlamydomonas_euryale.AAC.19
MAVAAEQEWNHAMDRQQEVVARQAADGRRQDAARSVAHARNATSKLIVVEPRVWAVGHSARPAQGQDAPAQEPSVRQVVPRRVRSRPVGVQASPLRSLPSQPPGWRNRPRGWFASGRHLHSGGPSRRACHSCFPVLRGGMASSRASNDEAEALNAPLVQGMTPDLELREERGVVVRQTAQLMDAGEPVGPSARHP